MSATSRLFFWSSLLPLISSWSLKPETSQLAVDDVTIPHSPDICRDQPYKTHLISEDPLVIYIESFITTEEALQLVGLRCVVKPTPITFKDRLSF
jgi:prolyl 4-hydroxylase